MEMMREEFESWHGEQFKYSDRKLTRHGETYLSPFVGGLWSAWQASRAALCVNLSDIEFSKDKHGDGGLILTDSIKSHLDDLGVDYE